MAKTPSNMIDIGTKAAEFHLLEPLNNTQKSSTDYAGKPLLLVFSCNHCPYVLHILKSFVSYSNEMMDKGLSVVMINSNDVDNYAADSPAKMIDLIHEYNFKFAYLYDASQTVAKAYQAACTPDFFLFNEQHLLVYRGQFDASRPGNNERVSGDDLRQATQALLNGSRVTEQQLPSLGCNIKWKEGNAPDYFNI